MRILTALFFMSLVLLTASDSRAESAIKVSAEEQRDSSSSTSGQSVDESLPLAKVGDDVITVGEFKKSLRMLSQTQRLLLQDEKSRRKYLEKVIDGRLVYYESLRRGLDKRPEVVEEIRMATEQIVVSEFVNQEIKAKVTVTPEAMEAFYNANRERFISSEKIHIRHILVSTEEEARDVLERLKNGEDFSELAKEKSIDPSGKRGGDLGWSERRVMDKDIAEAAFSMKKGEMSNIVRSAHGFHILRVEDKKEPEYKKPEEVKDIIRRMVSQQEEVNLANAVTDRLRKDAVISVNEELFRRIKIDVMNK